MVLPFFVCGLSGFFDTALFDTALIICYHKSIKISFSKIKTHKQLTLIFEKLLCFRVKQFERKSKGRWVKCILLEKY